MSISRPIASCLVAFLAAHPASAEEESEAPRGSTRPASARLFAEGLLAAGIQRDGLLADLRLRYRQRLYDSADVAFADNYVGAGVIEQLSPVFSQSGGYVEVAPASFFRVTAAYQVVSYFGVLGSLRGLSGCDDVSSLGRDDPRCDFRPLGLGEEVEQHSAFGHRAWVEALAQAKVGRFVAFDTFSVERWWFGSGWGPGGRYSHWFNELLAVPQRRVDTVLTNSGALLYEVVPDRGGSRPNVLVGAGADLAYATGTEYLTQRVGVVALCRIPAWRTWRDLMAVGIVQLYTHDRYLSGGAPFVGLAVSASTDNLLPSQRSEP